MKHTGKHSSTRIPAVVLMQAVQAVAGRARGCSMMHTGSSR